MKICMIVQDKMVKGGIAAVINGYRGSKLEKEFEVKYVESYKDGSKLTKLFKGISGYINFIWVLLIDKPNLIHIHSSFGASFYRKLPFIYIASLTNKPIINHIHGADFEEFYLMASNKKKQLIKKVYNKCSILIALSEEWKDRLKLIVPEDKIEVVENYSIVNLECAKENFEREPNNQILFLGEIGKRKGCYDIPRVIKIVAERIPTVKFVLGGDGDIEQIKLLLNENGVINNVIFPGWIRGEEKEKYLKESDIFFLPSYNEGMPMSILDAMGFGLPIVSTNVGGIPKIVNTEKNGYIYNPGEIENFANAIIELLENKSKLKSYSRNSFEIVNEKYSLELHLEQIKKIYNRY